MQRPLSWSWSCGCGGAILGLAAIIPAMAGEAFPGLALQGAGAAGVILALRRRPAAADDAAWMMALAIPALGPAIAWLRVVGPAAPAPDILATQGIPTILVREPRGGQEELPDPSVLAPLEDVIQSNASDEFKRSAVESLARLETPEAIEVLTRCLSHASSEVRAYALCVIGHLERRLAERIRALEEAVSGGGDAVTWLHLAAARFDCSYYHLARDQRRRVLLAQALDGAERAMAGGVSQALILAGRILLALGRAAEADDLFQRYLDQHGEDVKGLLWHAEALFCQGRYAQVRTACARVRALGGVPERMEPAMWMWA